MALAILIPIVTLIVVTVILTTVFSLMKRKLAQREQDARQRYPAAKIITQANFFGQESHGWGQIRGDGILILTAGTLIFEMWLPRREFRILLHKIQRIETPTSFLGKSRFRELLKVVFINEMGERDAMAWQVGGLEEIMAALKK